MTDHIMHECENQGIAFVFCSEDACPACEVQKMAKELAKTQQTAEDDRSMRDTAVDQYGRMSKDLDKVRAELAEALSIINSKSQLIDRVDLKRERDEALAKLATHNECMPRECVEMLLESKLPCGHPNNCGYSPDGKGIHNYCGWCQAIKARDEAVALTERHKQAMDLLAQERNQAVQRSNELRQIIGDDTALATTIGQRDEAKLLADNLQSHCDKYHDDLAAAEEAIRSQANRIVFLEAALGELIECKDIHDAIEQEQATPMTMGPSVLATLQADYKRRKPLAWETARAVMKTKGATS